MKVLITGATGLIGKLLTEKFFSTGIKVNFLTTKKSKIHSIKGASGFYWSPAKKILDLKCFDGVDSIIHLAGSRISRPWTKSNKKDILSSRVDSTRLLFLSLKNNIESFHIKSIVSASAIGIYPSEFKKTQTEKTNSTPNSFMERVVVAWEKEIENFSSFNIPVAKIRIGLVLSFSGGVLKALKTPTNLGLGTYFGNGEQGQPWIHINDLVEIFFKAYKDNWDGIFNGVAPNPVSQEKLTKTLAKSLKRPFFLPPFPKFLLKRLIGEMSHLVLDSHWVSSKKVLDKGFNFKFENIESAIKDLVKKIDS